jgi:hypothetical protein
MQPFEHMKIVAAISPGVIKDNADYVSYVVDTALAGGAQSLVFVGLIGSIDADMAVLKVMQSETKTDATTLAGTPTELLDALDSVVPGANDDNKPIVIIVDLKQPHARYLQLQAKAGNGDAGTYFSAVGFFTNVGVPATDLGALAVVRG